MDAGPDIEDQYTRLRDQIESHGLHAMLDFEITELSSGHVAISAPYAEELTNDAPGDRPMHGGIVATLIDVAGGVSVRSELDSPLDAHVVTIDLNVTYLKPATGDLVATADVIRVGGTVGVSEVTVECTDKMGETTEVAVGRGSFRIFR